MSVVVFESDGTVETCSETTAVGSDGASVDAKEGRLGAVEVETTIVCVGTADEMDGSSVDCEGAIVDTEEIAIGV